MAVASSVGARLFQRCAIGRFEDAQILLGADHTTGAVYLAGYGVECILKALILSSSPARLEIALVDTFRGAKAHDYRWLREIYFENGGSQFPADVNKLFLLVADWSTDLRYLPRTLRTSEAESFLTAAEKIILWVNERI